jgi:hypothetical protein
VKPIIVCAIAAASFGVARVARMEASTRATTSLREVPYAPSPAAAPFLSLGFREAAADLLFLRLRVYFGGDTDTARGIAELAEAIAATDPRFHRIYEYGAHAMMLAPGTDQSIYLRAIRLLEAGMKQFPDDFRIPLLAGQIYTQDLVTDDPAQRRTWDERGTLLVESASRKPGAPPNAAEWVAAMRTKLGEHERAVSGLRELILMTNDAKARKTLIERLAKLEQVDAEAVASELLTARREFEARWRGDRPGLPPTFYVLLGPRLQPGFEMASLATGGRELTSTPIERLEPLDDAPPQAPR